jgi:transcriptional regulator with XRE-family HTH domain
MSRREPMPGWGERIKRIRDRFGLDRRAFARFFDIGDTSVKGWEEKDSSTSPAVLKRGIVALGVPDVDRTLSWLADGEGPEPYWLAGEPGSPIQPNGPDGMVAMPKRALEVGREVFKILDGARTARMLTDVPALRAWNLMYDEQAFAIVREEEATSPEKITAARRPPCALRQQTAA